MDEQGASQEPKIDFRKVSEAILDLKVKRIQTSPFSKYIPITSQMVERDRQVLSALRAHNQRIKQLEAKEMTGG